MEFEESDVETILSLLLNTTPNEGSLPVSVIVAVILSCGIAACLMAACVYISLILTCIYGRTKYLR